jgi:hypothetical protein
MINTQQNTPATGTSSFISVSLVVSMLIAIFNIKNSAFRSHNVLMQTVPRNGVLLEMLIFLKQKKNYHFNKIQGSVSCPH